MWLNKTNNRYFNNLLQAGRAFGRITYCSTRHKTGYRETPTNSEIFLQIDRIFYKRHKKPGCLKLKRQPGKGKGMDSNRLMNMVEPAQVL